MTDILKCAYCSFKCCFNCKNSYFYMGTDCVVGLKCRAVKFAGKDMEVDFCDGCQEWEPRRAEEV